ncbi:stage V sporulation protein E [Sporolactobacillus vineae]|uniref:stage V sporulation protein E n=1 Tax=Sporolactobacillus vineae TaxID=444463 RepID=UPI0002895235|nr:stage V sporulation protein E [Sporolactobacillus vineae]
MPEHRRKPDLLILFSVLSLLVTGLVMVYSASAISAAHKFNGDAFYFLKRQLIFSGAGLAMMWVTMRTDYRVWKSWTKAALLICFSLLILVLIPGVGLARGGARSWLGIGAFSIQPSEFMKVAMILFLAKFLSENQQKLPSFTRGLIPALAPFLIAFGMIMLQPDFGTGVVLVLTCLVMIFAAGARIRHFVIMGVFGLAGAAALILSASYRIKRLASFFDPWKDPNGTGFQIIQSLLAIGPGGLLGFGLFQSRQKYQYLPEAQNDFIFAIISEELGLIGAAAVLFLFCLLLWRGIITAMRAPDLFGTLLALGITGMIVIQVMINIAVVTGLIPVTGITLPFLSYGGSSLTLMLISVGILLNISSQSEK